MRLPPATRLIAGFQHKEDAHRFLADLAERFARFGLQLKAENFIYEQLRWRWMRVLQRRNQKTRMGWPRFSWLAAGWLPSVRNMHPYPDQRFAATHPR